MQNGALQAVGILPQVFLQTMPSSALRAASQLSSLLLFSACRQHKTSHIRSRPAPLRAPSSSGLAASSDVTIVQKYQQLEKEMAKLKVYAARQAGAEAARAPHPRRVGGDLRTPAGLANRARVVRSSADEDEGAPTGFPMVLESAAYAA